MTLRIAGEEEEKNIEVRRKLTINNLKAIIKIEMKTKDEHITLRHKGLELIGNKQLEETRLEEGQTIVIIWQTTNEHEKVNLIIKKRKLNNNNK